MRLHELAGPGLAILLAACGQSGETTGEAANSQMAPGMSDSMDKMEMSGDTAAMMAKGTGTVTAIDMTEGKITLDHAPIPEANWPAMTMAFKAKPELIENLQAGDKVAFDLALEGGAGEVTAIQKQ
ncbi:copper-binding protein [Novosphingobium sp. PC22D]|uniref:copper-binding protein n=1 Tax=Novosphingobium sp. PC22D TaxID=1962403 RepID=UPI000BF17A08|nr:copper-binding protein [Novosphingobium sp. PC22D]PEQ12440.1 copper-binding protein [Novosphingobium sp. PC22D]